jgi:hypothetical protein
MFDDVEVCDTHLGVIIAIIDVLLFMYWFLVLSS